MYKKIRDKDGSSDDPWELKTVMVRRGDLSKRGGGEGRGWIQADPHVCVCCCVSQWVSSALAPAGNASTKHREHTHHPPFTTVQSPFDEGNTIHAQQAPRITTGRCLKAAWRSPASRS